MKEATEIFPWLSPSSSQCDNEKPKKDHFNAIISVCFIFYKVHAQKYDKKRTNTYEINIVCMYLLPI